MMKQISKLTIITAVLVVLFSSCMQKEKGSKQKETESPKKEIVRVLELKPITVARSVEYPAILDAYDEVHLAPATPGRINDIFVDVSDKVKKGMPLVQMDKTQLVQARLQLKNIEADFFRLDTLAKYGSVAKQQYDQIEMQYEVAKSNVEFLEENTRLLAPFNGVVSGRYYEPGEMYSGAPNTSAGKAAVLSIVQIDKLKVIVQLSEKYFPKLKKGMNVKIKVDTYPELKFNGQVRRIYPTIDAGNRTFKVEVVINNNKRLLRPGMFVRVTLDLDEEEAILLPSMAVLKLQGSNNRYLFVEENGVAKHVAVSLGKRYDDKIEVFSDELKIGDKVIVSGQARLLDGMEVEVKN